MAAYVGAVQSGNTNGAVQENGADEGQQSSFSLAVTEAKDVKPANGASPAIVSKQANTKPGEPSDDPAWDEIQSEIDGGKPANDIWFEAVKNKDVDIVKAFLKHNPEGWSVHAVDNAGRSALHWAVLSADEGMVEVLVGEGRIDMALVDEAGDSAYELVKEVAVGSNGGAFERIADYLLNALSGEAVAAYENGDVRRREVLVEAGAEDPDPEAVEPEIVSAETKRPPGDTRTAAEIIAANPVLANLSEPDKEFLKNGYSPAYAKSTFGITDLKFKGVGNFETDADAAYRAAKVLEHIQNFDEEGNPITGESIDGRIDGWTAERTNPRTGKLNPNSEAEHDTEAGRFQDFLKYGYSSLKGNFDPYAPPTPNELKDYQPLVDELDFRNDETTEEVDGRKLTVQELALKTMLGEYKDKIQSGEIKKDSAEYKFFYAMLAQGDIVNGRDLETHFEQQWHGTSSTSRDLGENKFPASGEDMLRIIDPEKVSKMVEEAMSDPAVAEDFNQAMVAATHKVPGFNPEQTREKLRTVLLSDGFSQHYEELKKTDPTKAEAEFQQLFSSYALLAGQESANQLASELMRDGLAAQLDNLLKDPESIPDDMWEAATRDWISLALGYTTSGTFFSQEVANLARDPAFVQLLKNKDFAKGLAEIQRTQAAYVSSGRMTPFQAERLAKQVEDLTNKTFTNVADRTKVTKFFDALNKNGFLSTATGWIAISSAINKLTDGVGLNGDPQENLSVANGFMFWLANGDPQLKFGREVLKHLKVGGTAALFGLNKMTASAPIELQNWVRDITTRTPVALPNTPGAAAHVGRLQNMMIGPEGDKVKLASATGAVRVLSALGYTAFGALMLSGAAIGLTKAETPAERAMYSLNMAAGTLFTGAGGAQFLAAVAGVKAASAWISRLGFPAIFLSVIGTIVAEVVAEQKENKHQVDYFQSLEKLGLLKGDWGENLEAMALFGYSKDRPEVADGKSIFDVYDMPQWLEDYREENKGNKSTNPHVPGLHFAQPAENAINAIVSNYGANIDLKADAVPALEGDLRDQFRNLVTYYLENIDSNDTAGEAAEWAVERIKDRLGVPYESSGDAREALRLLEDWLTKQGGMDALTALAGDVITDLKLTPDPNEKEEKNEKRKPNGLDWDNPYMYK